MPEGVSAGNGNNTGKTAIGIRKNADVIAPIALVGLGINYYIEIAVVNIICCPTIPPTVINGVLHGTNDIAHLGPTMA